MYQKKNIKAKIYVKFRFKNKLLSFRKQLIKNIINKKLTETTCLFFKQIKSWHGGPITTIVFDNE